MTKLFYYKAFSLTFSSDIPLPQLPLINKPEIVDVSICESQQPLSKDEPSKHFLHHHYDGLSLWLRVPHVALFKVSNGNTVHYSRQAGFVKELLAVTLMSTVIPHVLQQRKLFTLKAMAVEKAGKAFIFASPGSDGKSFLAAALMQRGFKVLADDVVAISSDGMVLPGFDRIKLWFDCLRYLKKDYSKHAQVRPGLEKYYLPLGEQYQSVPVALEKIVFYRQWNFNYHQLNEKKGIAKFMPLKSSIASLSLINETTLMHYQLQHAMAIAAKTPAYLLVRPSRHMKTYDLLDLITENILEVDAMEANNVK